MNQPISILLLEDSIYDAELTLKELRRQGVEFTHIHAQSKKQFLDALQKQPDIVLADYSLPQFNAAEALKLIKDKKYDLPMIVISGTIGEELAVEMMRLGAADYLMKDRLGRLSRAVQSALESAELRAINEQNIHKMEESNARYKSLFNDSPIALWEEDFSAAKIFLEELSASGVKDLESHFRENHADLIRLCQSRKLIAINQATVELYDAESKEATYQDLTNIQSDELRYSVMEYAIACFSGATEYHTQAWHTTTKGEPLFVSIHIALAPSCLTTWKKIFFSVIDLTEQKLAQQQVAESEALLSSMINASLDWIYVKNEDSRYMLANNTFAEGVGHKVEDIIGKNDEEIGFTLKTASELREQDHRIRLSENAESYYNSHLEKTDGNTFHFSTIKTPLYNAEGSYSGIMGISRDISDMLHAEEVIAESNARYKSLFEDSPISLWLEDYSKIKIYLDSLKQSGIDDLKKHFDENPEKIKEITKLRKISSVNQSTVALYEADSIKQAPIQLEKLFTEKSQQQFLEYILSFYEGKTVYRTQSEHLTAKGNKIFILLSITIPPGFEDTWEQVFISVIDQTDQHLAQHQVMESEALLSSIISTSLDWIFVKDKNHQYVLLNEPFAKQMGITKEDAIGKTDAEIGFSPEDASTLWEIDERLFTGDQAEAYYYSEILRVNEEDRHFSTLKTPLYDETGNVWGIVGIARDITSILHTETALQESQNKYEALFTSLVDGMFVHDMEGNILVANPVVCQRLGYEPDELIGKKIEQITIASRPKDLFKTHLEKVVHDGHISFVTQHVTKNGQILPVEVSSSLVEFQGKQAVLAIMRDISNVIETETALKNSEFQFQTLFDTVPDVIILCEKFGKIVHVNQTVCILTGYTYQEIINKHIEELSEEYPEICNSQGELASTEGRSNLTMKLKTHSGDIRLLDITARKTLFGERPVMMLVGRDQTDRIIAESKSQETQDLLRIMIDTIPQPIFVVDEDGSYVMVNQNLAELYQTNKEDILGKTNSDLSKEGIISASEAQVYHENAMIPLMTREPYFRPVDSFIDPDGIQHWYQIYTTPFKLPDQTMRVVGVGNEITHQMQAQSRLEALNEALELRVDERTRDLDHINLELQKAKEQLESMLQYSPDGFLLLDADLKIQVMNPALTRIIGLKNEIHTGMHVLETVSPKNVSQVKEAINKAISARKTISIEHMATHVNNSPFDCLTSISPIFMRETLSGIVIGVHDITPQKDVQRMKDAFVSNVSHELRTPITNFICNLELIRMNPKKLNIYLDRLDLEIVQLKNIIEDLLRLSRFDQNATTIIHAPFDVNIMCNDFSSLRTPLAEQKNLSLAFIPQNGLSEVNGDYGLVSQVLSILLTNAINYTQEGGEIIIRSHATDDQHPDMVAFSISDNGPGISEEERKKIFERFYRGQAGLDSTVSGTGLGLPIAHEIITRHNGKIEVFSTGIAGEGTQFYVWLPINHGITL